MPTTVIAFIGLLWGSSRFYASLDYAFSKVFHGERRRNEVVRTLRGLVVTFGFVALPIAALLVGSIATWVLESARDGGAIDTIARTLIQLASPIGSFVLFVGVVSLVYRFVPVDRVPWRAIIAPAVLVGVALAGFAQLFTFIAPRMVGVRRAVRDVRDDLRAAGLDGDQLQHADPGRLVDARSSRGALPAGRATGRRRA